MGPRYLIPKMCFREKFLPLNKFEGNFSQCICRECWFLFSSGDGQCDYKLSLHWDFHSTPVFGMGARGGKGRPRAGRATFRQSLPDRDESRRECTAESLVPTQTPQGDSPKVNCFSTFILVLCLDPSDSSLFKMPNG